MLNEFIRGYVDAVHVATTLRAPGAPRRRYPTLEVEPIARKKTKRSWARDRGQALTWLLAVLGFGSGPV